jgi:hypothetical protein
MALVLSHMRETLSNLTPKSLMVCTIQRICEQQLHTQPRWWTVQQKTTFEKTNKREMIQENEKSQKCSFGQSHNPQNQHRKSQQDQAKMTQNTNPKLKSVFEIPENLLNCHPMRRVWGSLKACTQHHSELNVRPCRCEVQKGADHAPVLSLVHSLVIFIWTKRHNGAHRSRHGLELCHVELLH